MPLTYPVQLKFLYQLTLPHKTEFLEQPPPPGGLFLCHQNWPNVLNWFGACRPQRSLSWTKFNIVTCKNTFTTNCVKIYAWQCPTTKIHQIYDKSIDMACHLFPKTTSVAPYWLSCGLHLTGRAVMATWNSLNSNNFLLLSVENHFVI